MYFDTRRQYSREARPLSAHGILGIVLGNALEFYDFGVYSFYAVIIGHAFFPFGGNFTSLLLSVGTFGVGFISRPLGGFILGAYADRHGRKPAMTLTIALMAISIAVIGGLPTYHTIGICAPILLILARLLQGFSTGGEVGASTIYLFEAAPLGRKALTTSWQLASQGIAAIIVGLVGFLLAHFLSRAALAGWGWRIPFLLGIVILPVGIYIRNHLQETLNSKEVHKSTKDVFSDLLSTHWQALCLTIAVFSGLIITQYFLIYMTTFALATLHMPTTTAMLSGFVMGICTLVFALTGGWLGDRFGAKTIMVLPRILLIFIAYPAMLFIVTAHSSLALLGMVALLTALQALSGGVLLMVIPYTFPPGIRTTGFATAFGLGVAIFGGTAQAFFTWLIGITHNPVSYVWYVIAMNMVSVVAMLLLYRLSRGESVSATDQYTQIVTR